MIFGMNLVFGQRERKEIGARTKRAMEEMALEKVHPAKSPYGYTRNSETGHLEIEPIEAQVVKRIFELYKDGSSIRTISNTLNEEKSYLRQGKWNCDKIQEKLVRVLNELTRYMYDIDNEIIVCNSTKTKDIKDVEKQQIDPNNDFKEYTIELLKKLDCDI